MQMNGVSKEIAAAIAAVHPSPHHLLTVRVLVPGRGEEEVGFSHAYPRPQAYESCSSQDAELLLQDVPVHFHVSGRMCVVTSSVYRSGEA